MIIHRVSCVEVVMGNGGTLGVGSFDSCHVRCDVCTSLTALPTAVQNEVTESEK